MKELLVIALMVFNLGVFAQKTKNDSSSIKNPMVLLKKAIVPSVLIGTGLFINNSKFEVNFQIDLQKKLGYPETPDFENYLKYAPIAELYIADLFGAKSKNHWFNQTKYLVFSNIISSGITLGLKHITQKTRPNGEELAFPSGHTTVAFTNATVLFNEFETTVPLLAYSGFAFATATGASRIIYNEHWLSDVLVGAGIGILSAHLVYYFNPLKKFNPFLNSTNITLTPYMNKQNTGLYFAYHL